MPAKSTQMHTYEEAVGAILQLASPLPSEEVGLKELLGRFLAKPVIATVDSPRFDNSAVDGYGILIEDVAKATEKNPATLKLLGEIAAGQSKDFDLKPGAAIKILTGAIVPSSVEAVVMREYCQEENGMLKVSAPASIGENIRWRAEEFKTGDTILPAGIKARPPVIGLLASQGYASFAAHALPRIAVIATGDELVDPGEELREGQIYNSNSYALAAAANALGLTDCETYHAKDNEESTRLVFESALADSDVVISAGGVSVGDRDFVKDVLEAMGVKTVLWRIAIKPGKPVYIGTLGNKLIFGLPGNPVSALVTFHQFVKPALLKMMGQPQASILKNWQHLHGRVTKTLKKKPGRLDFVRATIEPDSNAQINVRPTTGQESHMLSGLAKANAILHFAADADLLPENTIIPVDLLSWTE